MESNILGHVIAILTKQTGGDAAGVTGDTSLDTLGIDSFDFIEFLFLLEDKFNISIKANFTDIGTRLKTINDVAETVEALVREKHSVQDADHAGPAVPA